MSEPFESIKPHRKDNEGMCPLGGDVQGSEQGWSRVASGHLSFRPWHFVCVLLLIKARLSKKMTSQLSCVSFLTEWYVWSFSLRSLRLAVDATLNTGRFHLNAWYPTDVLTMLFSSSLKSEQPSPASSSSSSSSSFTPSQTRQQGICSSQRAS